MSRDKASHHHDASGDESENHDKVQAVPQRSGKAFERSSSVGKCGINAKADKRQDNQSASQPPCNKARFE